MESYVLRASPADLVGKGAAIRDCLGMELTERCNNNCAHCCVNLPAADESAKARELCTEEFVAILEEATTLNYMAVRFTGGEPLLRDDFVDLYLAARKMGLGVVLLTNATLITPEIADLFARIPPLEKVEVSVYGMTQKVYEAASRAPGSYEAAWRGIRLLLEKNVPFLVKGAVLPRNRGELGQFESWAATVPWMDHPPAQAVHFDLRCRRDDEAKNELIRKLRLSPEQGVAVLYADRDRALQGARDFLSKFGGPKSDELFTCGIEGCVDPYGYLHPCDIMRHPDTAYDLRKGTLAEGLTEFLPSLKDLKPTNPSYLERCARCFLQNVCEQCPSRSWAEHGTMDTPVEYFCEVAHAQGRYLGLLGDGEKAWEVNDWKGRIEAFAGHTT